MSINANLLSSPRDKNITQLKIVIKIHQLLDYYFPSIVSVTRNALLPAWHEVHDDFIEKSNRSLLNPLLDASLNVIDATIVISAQRLLELAKQVIIGRISLSFNINLMA